MRSSHVLEKTHPSEAPSEEPAQEEAHGGGRRAWVIGLLGVLFLCLAAPYTDLTLMGSELAGNHLPLGAVCVFLALVLGSRLLRRVFPRWRELSARELLLAFAMMLVAAGLPTFGLAAYLFPAASAPVYYATPENRYAEVLLSYVPAWLIPQDADAVRHFYLGLPPGATIPWGAWVRPLAAWSALALAAYLVILSLGVLMSDQWIRRERLSYPLMQLPLEVTTQKRWNWRDPLLLLGMAVPMALHTLNGLHSVAPEFPEIRLKNVPFLDLGTDKPLSYLRSSINIYFCVIAVAYLLPAEVSFSIPFFFFFNKVQYMAAYMHGSDLAFGKVVEAQYVGAFLVFVFAGVWAARPHLREVWRSALGQHAKVGGKEYRWALLGLLAGAIGMVAWLAVAGVRPVVGLAVVVIFIAICIGLGRIVVESGALFAKATQMRPLTAFDYLTGTTWLRPADVPVVGLAQYVFFYDLKVFLMPAVAHALKLGDAAGTRRRTMLGAMAAAILLGMVASYASLLWMAYHHGAIKMNSWFFAIGPRSHLDSFVSTTTAPRAFEASKLATVAAGGAFAWFLAAMRQRFFWWPFHPVGYVLAYSSETTRIWFPFLAGWLCKVLLLRGGGLRLYRSGCRFFWGLMIGEFAAAALWLVVSTATGIEGYKIFP
ncbi:MAG TPA: hypothetical protein PLY56_06585 [Armatimonadota bacterium]|nr:hypothetical protein [Armatimonadota bacterium]HOM80848.1 hypothetical protein [Armatimonadota bacterium]HOQ27861.1 hypothetical protein [Armatimonadota bacterium]HPO72279.1 hypothetical protein [Armatimonadota bacterium]